MNGRLRLVLAKVLRRDSRSAKSKLSNKRGKLTLRRILAQNTDEFCKNTTLHGLKYVASDELYPTERIFFALSFVAVMLISGFFIMKVYEKWATTPVIFGINPEPTFISNQPFPAVTICNLNQALKSKAMTFSKSSPEYAMLHLLCKRDLNTTLTDSTDWNELERFIINISQSCEGMVLGCRFGATEYNCSELFYPIVTDEGLCCVFNMVHPSFMYLSHTPLTLRNITSNTYKPVDWYAERGYPDSLPEHFTPRTTPGTGESLGLSVTLDVEYDKYYCSSSNSVGFKLALHSPNESPNVRETGVLIAPGMETKVRIRPEKTESEHHLRSVNRKYRHCLFHDEGRLKYFAHYTQRNCEMECMAEMLMKYCGCISFYMPKIYENETKICALCDAPCVERVRLRIDPSIALCLDDCLPSCYDLTFLVDVFAAQISHDGFEIVNRKVQQFDQRYVEKSIAVVNMYFKEYSFRGNIQTEFIGISDFLSSVGGLMGLFLGFSFISIAEFFYFAIIRPCRSFIKQRKSNAGEGSVWTRRPSRIPLKLHHNQLSTMRQYFKKRFMHSEQLHGIYGDTFKLANRAPDFVNPYMSKELLKSISQSLDRDIEMGTVSSCSWTTRSSVVIEEDQRFRSPVVNVNRNLN